MKLTQQAHWPIRQLRTVIRKMEIADIQVRADWAKRCAYMWKMCIRDSYTIGEGTQTGTTFRLKGKGIPYVNGRSRGDQYVTVVVETPTRLTREQKELLRKFEEATSESAQPKRKKFFEKLRDAFDK